MPELPGSFCAPDADDTRPHRTAAPALDQACEWHFYFQSGSLVVWLAADASLAEVAVEEVTWFYP